MFPANNINGIKEQEELLEGSHAIILLFVKPSDDNADNIIRKFNYLHYKSKGYCSIYLVGYSKSASSHVLDMYAIISHPLSCLDTNGSMSEESHAILHESDS